MVDVTVEDYGTVIVFRGQSDAARAYLGAMLDRMRVQSGVAVEPKDVDRLLADLRSVGLSVEPPVAVA